MIPVASPEAEKEFDTRALTGRERDAVRSVLAGMTAEEAAPEMGVSASTVGSFRQHAHQKLGISSARELKGRYAPDGQAEVDGAALTALLGHGLSNTQAKVLVRIAAGRSTAQIAEELHLAAGSVSAARAAGYRLLGIHSRTELARLLEEGAGASTDRKAPWAALVCAAVALAVVAVFALAAMPQRPATLDTPHGTIPNVVGMDPQAAWEALVDEGFLPVVRQARSVENPGTVAEVSVEELSGSYQAAPCDPSGAVHDELAGASWKAEAILGVSGMRQVPPQLVLNHSEREVRELLDDAGFSNVEAAYRGDVDAHANRVILTQPASSAWALPDELVTITVTSDVTVPSVAGMTPVDASSKLYLAGLTPNPHVTEWEYGNEGTPVAIGTDPPCGETVRVGDEVKIVFDRPLG